MRLGYILLILVVPLLGQVQSGGYIPVVSHVTCQGANIDRTVGEGILFRCWVTDNRPEYELIFNFSEELYNLHSLRMHGGGGQLGEGLEPLKDLEVLDHIQDGNFSWKPGEQWTPTLGYQIALYGVWQAGVKLPSITVLVR